MVNPAVSFAHFPCDVHLCFVFSVFMLCLGLNLGDDSSFITFI